MKWKCLLIVSLVLAIFAMGAVGASLDITQDDNITATSLNEDISNEKLSESDFDVNITEEIVDLDDENIENQSIVSFNIPENAKGEINIHLYAPNTTYKSDTATYEFEKESTQKIVNITLHDFRYNLRYIGPGDYSIELVYYDGYDLKKIANGTITFKRTVTGDNFKYTSNIDDKSETTIINFKISPLSGNITVYVNDRKGYSKYISQGANGLKIAQKDLDGLNDGENEISVKFISSEYGTINITQYTYFKRSNYTYIHPDFDITNRYLELTKIRDNNYINGTVTVTIDGKNVYNKTFNGTEKQLDIYPPDLNLSGITYETHYISVNYTKDSSQNIIGRNVLIYEAPHYYFPDFMHEGENEAIILHICENYTGKVNVTQRIDPDKYTDPTVYIPWFYVDLSNGYLRIPLEDVKTGKYKLEVTTVIDQIPNHTFKSFPDLIVKKNSEGYSSSISATTIPAGNTTTLRITGPSSAKNATVYVDGVKYGQYPLNSENISLNTSELDFGKHFVSVKYSTSEYEVTYSETYTLIVSQYQNPNMNVSISKSKISTIDNDVSINIVLPDDVNGKVDILMDSEHINSAETHGCNLTVKIPSNYLTVGNHNVTVTYSGDGKYANTTKSVIISVKEAVVRLTGNKAMTAVYSAKVSYKVLLTLDGKVANGKVVTINFNGKNYNIKTNSKGYAILNVNTKVKPKTYKITSTFNKVKVRSNIKIKHVIVAKNKIVKKSKKINKIRIATSKVNGKYLKSKTLKVKFKGKTYKIKTNKKGVATWKVKKSMLKKLKVGKKYKYKVNYGKDSIIKKLKIKK